MPSGYPGTKTHGRPGDCTCAPCRAANAAWQRAYRATDRGKASVRRMNLRAAHDITPEEYDTLLNEQDGVCAACGLVEVGRNQYGVVALAVDHDHSTGRRRGLLCMRCNRALGLLGDDPAIIHRLLTYRERWI